jgi:hypothetical protein
VAIQCPSKSNGLCAFVKSTRIRIPFLDELARTLHRLLCLRIPSLVLRSALREMSQLLFDGQRAAPTGALAAGFKLQYSRIASALHGLSDERHGLGNRRLASKRASCEPRYSARIQMKSVLRIPLNSRSLRPTESSRRGKNTWLTRTRSRRAHCGESSPSVCPAANGSPATDRRAD